jgi:hypothetical protein
MLSGRRTRTGFPKSRGQGKGKELTMESESGQSMIDPMLSVWLGKPFNIEVVWVVQAGETEAPSMRERGYRRYSGYILAQIS